jgi:protein subunit release factor A
MSYGFDEPLVSLIPKSELDVEVWRGEGAEDRPAVRLTHKPTGLTAEAGDGRTQVENYDAALYDLERQLLEQSS